MLEEFVWLGKWWLPSRPQEEVPGKLSFSPKNGITLELIGSFYDSQFEKRGQAKDIIPPQEEVPFGDSNLTQSVAVEPIKHEEAIILGLLDNNEEITLYKCNGRIKTFQFVKDRPILIFYADYIFRKIHFHKEQDINFKSLSIQYSYFEEWVGKSGVQHSIPQNGNTLLISYEPPSNIYLNKINELDLYITFSRTSINLLDFFKINVEQKTYLTIHNSSNKSLIECIDLLIDFRDLLSFAITQPALIISINGSTDVNSVPQDDGTLIEDVWENQVSILFPLWNNESNSGFKKTYDEMLFVFRDVENSLGDVFETWLSKRDIYESVFELLMITMYTPNLYLHYKFLNIIQALEVYHTNKYEGMYQDKKVYEKGLYKEFLNILKDYPSDQKDSTKGISDEFRNALKGKLKSQNRFTLETRLKEILKDIFVLLPDDFIGTVEDRESFARRASETRNALTHHDKKKREQAAKGQELRQLFYTLSVILKVCLMREINFTDSSVKTLIEGNRANQKEWRSSS